MTLDNRLDNQLLFTVDTTDIVWILVRFITCVSPFLGKWYPNLKLALSPPDGSVLLKVGVLLSTLSSDFRTCSFKQAHAKSNFYGDKRFIVNV